MSVDVVTVVQGPTPVVDVVQPQVAVVSVVQMGPEGPPGPPGSGTVFAQSTPLATWSFAHGLGRLPAVTIYIGGEIVFAQVDSDSTNVVVTFPSPQTGYLVVS